MTVKAGALEFDIIANNGQINSALDETKRRVQGFTDATVEGGSKMELAFSEAARTIDKAFSDIDKMAGIHKSALNKLETEYKELGEAAAAAFMKGTAKGDEQYRSLTQKQAAIKNEIATRKSLLAEIAATADELQKEEQRIKASQEATEKNTKAHGMLRTQLMNAKNALAEMEEAGQRGTVAYRELQKEVGRLQNAMGDANTQAKIMSHDNAGLQGVISAVSGVSGAFSAAQGVIGLFAGESENLQKVMLKVQSLMAITMGLQQVANTINKDSFFTIKILGGIKAWWADVVAKATIAETADTAATVANTTANKVNTASQTANTVATGAQTVAATAGTVANIGLAGAFRLVGTAIKSIPVFGWILAGVTALISLVAVFSSKAREAKKEAEGLRKKTAELAAEPVTAITALSNAWMKLGNNMEAKKKFIEDNKDKFRDLGFSIKTVKDAEDLLVANKSKFIEACLQRAKALAIQELAVEKYKEVLKAQQELENTPRTKLQKGGEYIDGYGVKRKTNSTIEVTNPDWDKAKENADKIEEEYNNLIKQQVEFSAKERELLDSIGAGAEKVVAGSIAALEDSISKLREKYKEAATDKEREALLKQIKEKEAELEKINNTDKKTGTTKTTDPYTEMLENRKKEYQRYLSWVNSTDDVTRKAAKTEFAGLLKEGSSYIDFLQKQRDELLSLPTRTAEQDKNLVKLNNELATESKNTIIGEFEKELKTQLDGADSILAKLDIIAQKRKELDTDDSGLVNEKKSILDKEDETVAKQAKEQTDALLNQYNEYLGKRIDKSIEFENQMQLLRRRAASAQTDDERKQIEGIASLYESLHELHIESFEELDHINADSIYRYGSFEQKRLMIAKDYEKLIGAARLAGEEEVAQKLEGERDLEILKETEQYKEFFGDISEISIKTLENTRSVLLAMMKEAYNAGKITADQYKKLIDEINKQADSAYSGRGIEAIFGTGKGGGAMNFLFGKGDLTEKINSFKTIFSGANKDMSDMASTSEKVAGNMGKAEGGAQGAAGGAAATLAIVDAIITGVYQTLKAVSDTLNAIAEYQDSIGNSDSAETLGDWADCINAVNETAMSGWQNLKDGNVMGAISDTISMPFKLLTTLNRIHDKHIDKDIKRHAGAVKNLENQYKELERAVDKALGGDRYKTQKASIQNLKKQQEEYAAMVEAERGKKKVDDEKIKEYTQAIKDNADQIEDIVIGMREDILGGPIASIANDLGNALIDAFAQGEDAAEAFGKKADEVVAGIIRKMLIQKLIEQPVGQILDKYAKKWVDKEGNFLGFDNVLNSLGGMAGELKDFGTNIASVIENLPDDLKKYLLGEGEDSDPTSSLSGAIKGASQESIDLLSGQTNAVRIQQVESIEIMREQLIHLANIDGKLGVSNRHLEQIEKNTSANASDPLRAQGIKE